MRASKGAATRFRHAGIVALVPGVGSFLLLAIETRGGATAGLSNNSRNRPSMIVTPGHGFAASSHVHQQLQPSIAHDAHSHDLDQIDMNPYARRIARAVQKYRMVGQMRKLSIDSRSRPSTQEFV
jgi:hypothetical protein